METFLQFPATISVATLLSLIVLISLMSVVFLHLIKFLINERAWNKEIIDAYKMMDFFTGLVCDKEGYEVYVYGNRTYSLQDSGEGWVFSRCGVISYLELSKDGEPQTDWFITPRRASYFKTKQEAEDFISLPCETRYVYNIQLDRLALLLLAPAFDIALMFFKMNPVATISVILTAALVWGTRWISGKLAHNVNKTNNHEERITKLEEK